MMYFILINNFFLVVLFLIKSTYAVPEFSDLQGFLCFTSLDTSTSFGTNFRCQYNLLPTNLEGCCRCKTNKRGTVGDTATTDWQIFCTRYLHNYNRENPSTLANVVQKNSKFLEILLDCRIKRCDGY